jgi:hypothetical protein
MTIDIYTTDRFQGLGRDEQIAKYRAMAVEATRLATNGIGWKRGEYANLSERWSTLADEIEQAS